MGEKKRRLSITQRMIREHPLCCYCGNPSETVDEMPPKCMFWGKQWPEGFQFPACKSCNNGRRHVDLLVGYYVKACDLRDEYQNVEETRGLANLIRARYPELLPKLANNRSAQQQIWRAAGFEGLSNLVLPDLSAALSPEGLGDYIEFFLLRLLQALHYKETGKIIPHDFLAAVTWRSNAAFMKPNAYDELTAAAIENFPIGRATSRSGKDLTDQFSYRYGKNDEEDMFAFYAQFGTALVGMGFSAPEKFFYNHSHSPTHRMNGARIAKKEAA